MRRREDREGTEKKPQGATREEEERRGQEVGREWRGEVGAWKEEQVVSGGRGGGGEKRGEKKVRKGEAESN